MKTIVLGLIGSALFAGSTLASLTFEKNLISYTAKPSDEEYSAVYKFKNTTDQTVKISQVIKTCGCLSVSVDPNKKEFQPGESGSVTVVFEIGSMAGDYSKKVEVETDSDRTSRTTLFIHMNIPEVVKATPNLTKWQAGEPAAPQLVEVEMQHEEPINILEVKSTRPTNVIPELVTVEEGKKYQIKIQPASTAKPELGMLTILTDSKFPRFKKKSVFFQIQRPLPKKSVAKRPETIEEPAATPSDQGS